MNTELYLDNLKRNKKMLVEVPLIDNICILDKKDNMNFVIDKNNIDKINLDYLEKIDYSNKDIVIDSELFNIFDDEDIKNLYEDDILLNKNKFKNIYLIKGNNILDKCYEKIKIILGNYKVNTDKIYVINYDKRTNYFLNDLYYLITAYGIKDNYERASYIYDIVSSELDRRFNKYNLCDFKDNKCIRKRELVGKYDDDSLNYGCCFTKGRVCPNLKKNTCSIKSIGCKFFTCNYLKKKGIDYKPSDFLLIKKFLSLYDMYVISDKIYTSKEETLDSMLKS